MYFYFFTFIATGKQSVLPALAQMPSVLFCDVMLGSRTLKEDDADRWAFFYSFKKNEIEKVKNYTSNGTI